ncbi:hypothetical protein [Nocardia salmonicida]|uniref:hypothetical protein n=1 Tax=Nocardia salmonicida TaxID=53431 RepID=UPI0037A6BEE1
MVTQLALPAPPVRLALPWGDSAYTSFAPQRWLPGDPAPQPGWCLGPPANGLTPSSEGPRRRAEAEGRVVARMADRVRLSRLDRLLEFWGDIAPDWEISVGYEPNRPYAQPVANLDRGNRVGWTDQHGTIHTGVITDRRDTRRGTELDITPDEEGPTS